LLITRYKSTNKSNTKNKTYKKICECMELTRKGNKVGWRVMYLFATKVVLFKLRLEIRS
jgi:hypothetical protein